jgi:hypothetical protein
LKVASWVWTNFSIKCWAVQASNLSPTKLVNCSMPWPIPAYSRGQVNRAGEILRNGLASTNDLDFATDVLTNWRACHGYPLNTFQATLRRKLRGISPSAFVAQRLKRSPSIISKLQRFPEMQLARMQDIGGLRAVVPALSHVKRLVSSYQSSRFLHELVSTRDYIASPKTSGYRSVHLVYRYRRSIAIEANQGPLQRITDSN